MGKDETTEKDDATAKGQGGKEDKAADSGAATDIKPVRPKIGESKDNLRKRSEWFQKRHGDG